MENIGQKLLAITTAFTVGIALLYLAGIQMPVWTILVPIGLLVSVTIGIPFVIGALGIILIILYVNYCFFVGLPIYLFSKKNDDGEVEIEVGIPTGEPEEDTEENQTDNTDGKKE